MVGLPGSGKSTVGRHLAKRLGLDFVDSDHVIEARLGCAIREYFDQAGEPAFRDLEEQVVDELSARSGLVLSTGGGTVLREANRRVLNARGTVVYLKATPDDIFRRLRHDKTRPLLQVEDPLKRLKDLFGVRDPLYREVAHLVLETGRPSVTTLVNNLAMQIEQRALNLPPQV
jgi:shikimate kinase